LAGLPNIPITVQEITKANKEDPRIIVDNPDEMGAAMVEAAMSMKRQERIKNKINELSTKREAAKEAKDLATAKDIGKAIAEHEQALLDEQRELELKNRRCKAEALSAGASASASSSSCPREKDPRFPKGDPYCEKQRADLDRTGMWD
jgi:hypothetical protein